MTERITRRKIQQRLQNDPRFARNARFVLGDNSGQIYETTTGLEGYYRVREITALEDGGPQYSGFTMVKSNGASLPEYPNAPVRVGLDDTGEPELQGADFYGARQAGMNPLTFNPSSAYRNSMSNLEGVSYLRSYSKATVDNPTMRLAVQAFKYIAPDGTFQRFGGGDVDLTSDIPGTANEKRLVLVYLDTSDNTLATIAGTAKDEALAFDPQTDIAEVIEQLPLRAYPSATWILKNGDTTIDNSRKYSDERQWITMSHDINTSTSAPGTGDDTDSGYGVGSLWIDTDDDTAYLCVDASSGAAVWQEIGAGSSGTITVDGTSGIDTINTSDRLSSSISSSTATLSVVAAKEKIYDETLASDGAFDVDLTSDLDTGYAYTDYRHFEVSALVRSTSDSDIVYTFLNNDTKKTETIINQGIAIASGYAILQGPDLRDSLSSWWLMDEAAGNNRVDSHGSNDLVEQGGNVAQASGVIAFSNAASFNRTDDNYLQVGADGSIDTGDVDYTLACWIYPELLDGTYQVIIGKWADDKEYLLQINSNNLEFVWRDGSGSSSITVVSSASLSVDTWYHVVAYHDATNDEIGIIVDDGTPDTTATGGASPSQTTPSPLKVGQEFGAAQQFAGRVDLLKIVRGRIWNSDEIAYDYSGIVYGNTLQAAQIAQQFSLSSADTVDTVTWQEMQKFGSPSGTLTLEIQTDSSGEPSGTLVSAGATGTASESSISSLDDVAFTLNSSTSLSGSTTYWLVLKTSRSQSDVNFVTANAAGTGSGAYVYDGATWSQADIDGVATTNGFSYSLARIGNYLTFEQRMNENLSSPISKRQNPLVARDVSGGATNSDDYAHIDLNIPFANDTSSWKRIMARGSNINMMTRHDVTWQDTSAVNRIRLEADTGDIASGSKLVIYGVR